MSILEILATIFTLGCVFSATKLSTWQYPLGIIGTILYFFVFWQIGLFFCAWLQVFFTFVQLYGWWYWLYGNNGAKPKVRWADHVVFTTVFVYGTVFLTGILMWVGKKFTDTPLQPLDAAIFSLSVIAQWYLDRKQIQTWTVWLVVNIISIPLFYSQGLYLTTGVYVICFFNAIYGFYCWYKEMQSYKTRVEV